MESGEITNEKLKITNGLLVNKLAENLSGTQRTLSGTQCNFFSRREKAESFSIKNGELKIENEFLNDK